GPGWLRERQLAMGNTVRPVGEVLQCDFRIESRDIARHQRSGSTRLKSPPPCLNGIRKCAKLFRDGTHSLCSECMTGLARAGFDDGDQVTRSFYPRRWDFVCLRDR